MSNQLENVKFEAIQILQTLCIRCKEGLSHSCRIGVLIREIEELKGVPVIVNSKLYHVVFN